MTTAPPAPDDLLRSTTTAERPRALDQADVELMKIMWARVGWPEPDPTITEIERNPNGKTKTQRRRARVVPPGRDVGLLYWGPSNTAEMPDGERHALIDWKLARTAEGIAQDPGLQDLVIAAQGDKEKMKTLVWRAINRARGDEGADKGTARHEAAEKLDFLGWDALGPLSPRMRADLEAYQEATRGIDMVLGEMFVVDDVHKMGGTFDRVCYYQGRYYIADLKPPDTGWGQGAHAIQFAIYSRCELYNWNLAQRMLAAKDKTIKDTNLRAALPGPIDLERAIVIHVPRDGIGRAYTAWVDIASGWKGFQLAGGMRRWQNRDFQESLVTPFEPVRPATVIDVAPAPSASGSGVGNGLVRVTGTTRPPRSTPAVSAPASSIGIGPLTTPALGPAAQRALGAAPEDDGPLESLEEVAVLAKISKATTTIELKKIYRAHAALWTGPDAPVAIAYRDKRTQVEI